jgi:hypothetical protein
MFNRFTPERKRRAELQLKKAREEFSLAGEILNLEGEIKTVKKQTALMVEAADKVTNHKLKLLQSANGQMVKAQISGMSAHLEQSLPQLLEARQKAGAAMIAGSLPQQIQAVKERANR